MSQASSLASAIGGGKPDLRELDVRKVARGFGIIVPSSYSAKRL
jgi:hypothetical protein